ncbi:hypothetical protein BDN67DRAFT_893487, partial [Paxillus ammoniavirescens]
EEWGIVLLYTPRVQELTLEYDDLSLKILQSLTFRTTLLLPNLQRLSWVYSDYTIIASMRLLLSPSLIHLHIYFDLGDHSSVLGLLQSCHVLCPNLKSVHFAHLSRLCHVTNAISRAICRAPMLESIKCDLVDEAALIHIAQSTTLKKFGARLFNCPQETLKSLANYGTPDDPPFRNVHILDLHVEVLSSIIPLFRPHHQAFRDITLYFHTLPTIEVLQDLFSVLGSSQRQCSLQQIALHSFGLRIQNARPQPLTFHALSPLLHFNRLRRLDLNLTSYISLNDEELAELSRAWPDLEALTLNQCIEWNWEQSVVVPTLTGLLSLLAHCPKLRDLGLRLDARNVPCTYQPFISSSSQDEYTPEIRNTSITKVLIADSLIQEPVSEVARFLAHIFPSLTAITMLPSHLYYFGQVNGIYYPLWVEVTKQIRDIRGGDQARSPESSDSEGSFDA